MEAGIFERTGHIFEALRGVGVFRLSVRPTKRCVSRANTLASHQAVSVMHTLTENILLMRIPVTLKRDTATFSRPSAQRVVLAVPEAGEVEAQDAFPRYNKAPFFLGNVKFLPFPICCLPFPAKPRLEFHYFIPVLLHANVYTRSPLARVSLIFQVGLSPQGTLQHESYNVIRKSHESVYELLNKAYKLVTA